ncbi:MAG: hypothetical protein AB8F34_14325, partial [Akkermansiaceae bacterium]
LGVSAAALHGWQDDFSGQLSDVDYAISQDGFNRLVEDLAAYTRECGWQLCQVLRHESTAAFCVCSWNEDPSRVVALDACSDYRRLERILISAEELLENRQRLEWGGYRLSETMELRYRFTKAAVKNKPADVLAPELAEYSNQARKDLETWLQERWTIKLEDWNSPQQANAWERLGALTLEGKKNGLIGSFRRVAWRITRPTGLVVTNVNAEQDAAVIDAFNRLYFRRSEKVKNFKLGELKKLLVSTLLRCDSLGAIWKRLLGRDLWLEASPEESPAQLVKRIATHLNQRCLKREGVSSTSP